MVAEDCTLESVSVEPSYAQPHETELHQGRQVAHIKLSSAVIERTVLSLLQDVVLQPIGSMQHSAFYVFPRVRIEVAQV